MKFNKGTLKGMAALALVVVLTLSVFATPPRILETPPPESTVLCCGLPYDNPDISLFCERAVELVLRGVCPQNPLSEVDELTAAFAGLSDDLGGCPLISRNPCNDCCTRARLGAVARGEEDTSYLCEATEAFVSFDTDLYFTIYDAVGEVVESGVISSSSDSEAMSVMSIFPALPHLIPTNGRAVFVPNNERRGWHIQSGWIFNSGYILSDSRNIVLEVRRHTVAGDVGVHVHTYPAQNRDSYGFGSTVPQTGFHSIILHNYGSAVHATRVRGASTNNSNIGLGWSLAWRD
ncbi:MAG: hypothetical protein FWD35_03175 [Oscillospiraceae bacterium]|nr:hypothetical protein [Oscillospiraceae bacterium]